MSPPTFVAVGECMLEMSAADHDWTLSCGGDTFNTAVHVARWGWSSRFLTALGSDPFSRRMLQQWVDEGLNTSLVLTHPSRLPGLYAIETDDSGERRFHYWRGQSAARAMFDLPNVDDALVAAQDAGLLHLSGITLSLFDDPGRLRLGRLAADVRVRGGRVSFDSNYRPAVWHDRDAARRAITALAPYVSVALVSFDDERELWGDEDASATIQRWQRLGVPEVVVKDGSRGAWISDGAAVVLVPTPSRLAAVDTTGAGDAFNAGYLAAAPFTERMRAVMVGHLTAGVTVRHRGAIPPPSKIGTLGSLIEQTATLVR